jgi:hypothetical protein
MEDEFDEGESWKRTAWHVERDETMARAFALYRNARIALEFRQAFGRLPQMEIPNAPAWLIENFDESGMAVLRHELVETFNEYRPADGWEFPDGEIGADWQLLPQDPSKLIEWVDADVHRHIARIAADATSARVAR